MLNRELFEIVMDVQGKQHLAIRDTVPLSLLQAMGLLTGETQENETELRSTQIPVKAMANVRDCCAYTADFGMVAETGPFCAPVQLITIPCRSSSNHGRCMRLGQERTCTLFGFFSHMETLEKERINILVAPILPATQISAPELEMLLTKREIYVDSLRQWETAWEPINLLIAATQRGMEFWWRAWFGR